VKIAFIIDYYFNGTDNPKPKWNLDGKKCVVQNVRSMEPGASEAGLILQRSIDDPA
jgi:hypothetical protein